jgi:hypothetical protein
VKKLYRGKNLVESTGCVEDEIHFWNWGGEKGSGSCWLRKLGREHPIKRIFRV